MHRRIVLGKSLAPFVAIAVFPAAATAAMAVSVRSSSAANAPARRVIASADLRAAPALTARRVGT